MPKLNQSFFKTPKRSIKVLHLWDRVGIDFKGPLQGRNKYILFATDEYSRFPFAFPCRDMTTSTVIKCLSNLFCLFGLPSYVHSDRGSAFLSSKLKKYLTERGIATSKSTPYHPSGNTLYERICWSRQHHQVCHFSFLLLLSDSRFFLATLSSPPSLLLPETLWKILQELSTLSCSIRLQWVQGHSFAWGEQ